MNLENMRLQLVDRVRQLPDAQLLWLNSYLDRLNDFSKTGSNIPIDVCHFENRDKLQELRMALLRGEQSGIDINFDSNDFLKGLHKKYVKDAI